MTLRTVLLFSLAAVWVCVGGISVVNADGLSVVNVGNSHSHPLRLLIPLSAQLGHTGFKEGTINILGASLGWIWDHDTQDKWSETLAAANKWDAITLLSWDDKDSEYAPKFAAEAYKGNPQCQVYIYVIWPDANMSFDTPAPVRTEAHGEAVAAAVATAFPTAPKPRVIPTSLLIRELGHLADMGELPGVANRFALFSDGGHLSQFGQYAVNVMICSMLYGESPKNYPSDIFRTEAWGQVRGTYESVTVPDDTAVVIKRTAWDILQTYPPAGMKPGLVIANRRLDVAIAGQPYHSELKALNATEPCHWSLTQGTLPKGFSLAETGVISGQSRADGQYPITITLSTGQQTLERQFVLNLNKDLPPYLPDVPLPTVSLDSYIFQPIKVVGGVRTINWSLSKGTLPYGIMLSPAGILVGTAGEDGTFTFTIKAEDSYPAGARAVEKEFSWVIGAKSPLSMPVKYVITSGYDYAQVKQQPNANDWKTILNDSVIKIEGKLDEPYWNFNQSIEKTVQGTPTKKATFSAIWTANCTGYTIPGHPLPVGRFGVGETPGRVWSLGGSDVVLAIKILDGPNGKTPKDGVHVFIDGRHDGKLIYGADDLHFFIPRTFMDIKHSNGWAPMVSGLKPLWFSKVAVAEIDGGYTVELSLGSPNFTGDGQWLSLGARGVYGLDIAVDEGTDGAISQQVWRGDANDAKDTSHFGTIVLTGLPALVTPPAK